MGDPNVINQVFDGAGTLLNGGKAIANAAFTTMDVFSNLANGGNAQQQQQAPQMFSRRDMGYQMPQQSIGYQPSTYPWAQQTFGGYGFTNQGYQNNGPGYPGISNPNYGRHGFYGQTWYGGQSQLFGNNNNGPIGSNWTNGIWR